MLVLVVSLAVVASVVGSVDVGVAVEGTAVLGGDAIWDALDKFEWYQVKATKLED